MTVSREQIHAALFQLLTSAGGFITTSRTLKHWSDVPAASQPALFQAHRAEMVENPTRGAPARWSMSFDIYVYANTASDPAQSPSTVLNPLLDAIVAALAPNQVTGVQTLGGLVHHCWISGRIESDEGTLGNQGVLIIPIDISVAQ